MRFGGKGRPVVQSVRDKRPRLLVCASGLAAHDRFILFSCTTTTTTGSFHFLHFTSFTSFVSFSSQSLSNSDKMNAPCPTCEEVQEVEYADETETLVVCLTCGDEFSPPDKAAEKYQNYAGNVST